MPIPVGVTGPTVLVTLADVHTHLQIPLSNTTYDTQLQGFIDAATAYVQFQTGPIINQTYTEVHSGGGPTIVLDNPPLISVTSVIEYIGLSAYTLNPAELGTDGGFYAYSIDDPNAGILCRRYAGGLAGSFAPGYRNIAVVYTAGLTSVPGDVRMAVLEDLRGLFTQTQYGGPSASFGGDIGDTSQDDWNESMNNPVGSFPRLAALLQGPSRTPSLA